MNLENQLNFDFFLKKLHTRLQPEVLKLLQFEKKKIIKRYFISSLGLLALITNILVNLYYCLKSINILFYEKSVKQDNYHSINLHCKENSKLIEEEKLNSEEIKTLLSLNMNEFQIGLIIEMIKKDNYFTYKDINNFIQKENIQFEAMMCGIISENEYNKLLQVREEIQKKHKNLLLDFEKNNNIHHLP